MDPSIYNKQLPVQFPERTPFPKNAYGYPITSSQDAGVDDYFKKNQHVAGMAWGGGENGTDPASPRTIVVNPYNPNMGDPVKRDGLLKVEAARHIMGQEKISPSFGITPKQQEWRKGLGAYATDDNAFKQSIISRLIVGDEVPDATKEQKKAADDFHGKYFSKDSQWNPNPQDLRADGSQKGTGFLGVLKRPDGDVSTELSMGFDWGQGEKEIPTLVPTLNKKEVDYLLSTPPDKLHENKEMFQSIATKAVDHAKQRIKDGKPVFALPDEAPKK